MFKEDAQKALFHDEVALELPVILVERGNCHFVTKVKNIEKAGAFVALVGDNKQEASETMVMQDDGTGHQINIPSFLIRYTAFEEIKATYEDGQKIIFRFSIDHPNDKDGKVDVDLWYSSVYDLSPTFLASLSDELPQLYAHINFNLRIMTTTCYLCLKEQQERDCFTGGAYCPMEPMDMFMYNQLDKKKEKEMYAGLN